MASERSVLLREYKKQRKQHRTDLTHMSRDAQCRQNWSVYLERERTSEPSKDKPDNWGPAGREYKYD
ncbi:hypothetical protein BaRGS_00025362 [Batillaria attramentaria]|uniref:Uncharacterized protein n=1 Tax=Batillaria attramentaria TaxID=370345 RepID=A0ABD0K8N6_9CAEN